MRLLKFNSRLSLIVFAFLIFTCNTKVYANVGNGTLSVAAVGANAAGERWNIVCSLVHEVHVSGTLTLVYDFTVNGSVSGDLATMARAGTEYISSDGELRFTIRSGNISFVVGDKFNLLTPPSNLVATSGSTMELSWDPVTMPGIEGYNVYRGTTSGVYGESPMNGSSLIKNVRYIDSDFSTTAKTVYYYIVKAVDKDGAASSASNEVSVTYGVLTLRIPNIRVPANTDNVKIPVNMENADGLKIKDLDMWVEYDRNILEPTGVQPAVLSEGYNFSESHDIPGRLWVELSSGTEEGAIKGEGTIFNMIFNVRGNEGDVVDLYLLILVIPKENGGYFSADLYDGSLTLSSACTLGDLSGDAQITIADVSLALKIAVESITQNECQQSAGDTNGDGRIGASDAALISYRALNNDWPSLQALPGSFSMAVPSTSVSITMPGSIGGFIGKPTTVPIKLSDVGGLAGAELMLTYDSSVAEPISENPVSVEGLVTSNFTLEYNVSTPGTIKIALSSGVSLASSIDEIIVNITFSVSSSEANSLRLASYNFYDSNGRDWERSSLSMNIDPTYFEVAPPTVLVPSMNVWGKIVLLLVILKLFSIFSRKSASFFSLNL